MVAPSRKLDRRLPREGNSNSLGARPVHQTISMIELIRTSRLSISVRVSRKLRVHKLRDSDRLTCWYPVDERLKVAGSSRVVGVKSCGFVKSCGTLAGVPADTGRDRGRERERERDKRLDSPLSLHAPPHTLGYTVERDQVAFHRGLRPIGGWTCWYPVPEPLPTQPEWLL